MVRRSGRCTRASPHRRSGHAGRRRGGDVVQHGPEHRAVERPHAPPVEVAAESVRHEDGPLAQPRSVADAVERELEPRETGQLHLGPQPEQPIALDRLHAPEVHRLADGETVGMAASPPQPDTPDHPVHEAARRPRERERVPTPIATDALDDSPHTGHPRVDVDLAYVAVDAATCPLGIGGHRVARCARPLGTRPPCGDVDIADLLQRPSHRLLETQRPERDHGLDVVLSCNHRVPERLDERLSDRLRNRGDDVHPLAREPR